ncbi:MAG: hypothetical protein IJQ85_07315 [Selenomonadaceae bacterium]|nr:hypothetical protein [Selenomonadaceae bacterium]
MTSAEQNNLIEYSSGNDTIRGFNAISTLQIGIDTYSSQISGSDIILTVGEGNITLADAILKVKKFLKRNGHWTTRLQLTERQRKR